ncbi:alpha/beta-hydrolase [Lojkania enalia]|uniref:Alpha/beta-hydrolase n=1 Tax=Lojkania enalia TaxID=147567 RepID=A0A9P4KHE2_9PLEO|nr:alpha/beta-hydrolase [Didymosphaeria enalia]
MPFGPFTLQWRSPSPNPLPASPLPPGITRTQIHTPCGPLELLSAIPANCPSSQPPLFFAHGGFGCAEIWLAYLAFFSSRGVPCYAISYRGHGKSWYPGFWRMYFTTRAQIAEDLVAGIKYVENVEKERRGLEDDVRVVLVAHSAGGRIEASCYRFWAWTAPIHFPYRLFHPRYVLANTEQVRAAFFKASTPVPVVKHLEGLLAPYESMLWPVQMLPRFATGGDVISSILGWSPRKTISSVKHTDRPIGISQRMMVLAAEHDVLCQPGLLLDAAQRYRASFWELVQNKKLDGVSGSDLRIENDQGDDWDGVRFRVVPGVAHHLQNEVEWEKGAREILAWMEQL